MTTADARMLTDYNTFSAAHHYALGFTHLHHLYVVRLTFAELTRYAKADRMSSKRGGWRKVRLRLSADERAELAATAELLGDDSLLTLDPAHNKGENLERELTERWLGERWVKDSVPFWVAGDLVLDGVHWQVKLDGAELTNERCLAKAAEALGLA